jgi:hypothetical protein
VTAMIAGFDKTVTGDGMDARSSGMVGNGAGSGRLAAPTAERRTCAGVRRDGQPCQSRVVSDGTYCYVHSPAHSEARAEARRRGGRNRSSAVRLRGLVPPRLVAVYDRLEQALDEVLRYELDHRNATAAASVARAMVAVLTAGELEERVRKLESGHGDTA